MKNNEKKLSDPSISYYPPLPQVAEAGNLEDALSEMLRDAVTQLLNTEGFGISSDVYSSVARGGESHLPVAGSAPRARRAARHSCYADTRLEVSVVSNTKQSLLGFSFIKSTALSVKTQLHVRGK